MQNLDSIFWYASTCQSKCESFRSKWGLGRRLEKYSIARYESGEDGVDGDKIRIAG